MILPIKEIRKKEVFWLLRELSKTVKKAWDLRISIFDNETDAEYQLAIAKSHRIEDEIEELSEIDLELNWGCERMHGSQKGTYITKKTGDFNPWYEGKLTLDELLQALSDLYSFSLGPVEPDIHEMELVYYYQELEKYLQSKKPKPKYSFTEPVFWNDVHDDVKKISKPRFDSGQYADSVEAAFKHINARVKDIVQKKIGRELDGSDLMQRAFSVNDPVILLDDLRRETGRNIQVGYMQIFAGSMTGIRNPKAHDNISITKERAMLFLFLASLLLNKLDEAKVVRPPKIPTLKEKVAAKSGAKKKSK